jgi:hypothetical protein
MRALRALPLLDPVRAPGYPDDIKCLLFDKTGSKDGEWIWAKVIRQDGDGLFLCRLINEPFQDFGFPGTRLFSKPSTVPRLLLHAGGLRRITKTRQGA